MISEEIGQAISNLKKGDTMDLLRAVEKMLNEYYDSCGRLDVGPGKAGDLLPKIFEKASKNLKFRKKILDTPVEALAQEGFKLPKGFTLKFIEETENTINLPLLPFIGQGYDNGTKDAFSELDEIIHKANTDMDFRNQLIKDPKGLLKKKGFSIEPQKDVRILECTDDVLYAILPAVRTKGSGEIQSIELSIEGNRCYLSGRLDTIGVEKIRDSLLNWNDNLNLDLKKLDYISSAGLGLLLMTLKKLNESSYEMKLFNLKPAVRNVFVLAGFDTLFKI